MAGSKRDAEQRSPAQRPEGRNADGPWAQNCILAMSRPSAFNPTRVGFRPACPQTVSAQSPGSHPERTTRGRAPPAPRTRTGGSGEKADGAGRSADDRVVVAGSGELSRDYPGGISGLPTDVEITNSFQSLGGPSLSSFISDLRATSNPWRTRRACRFSSASSRVHAQPKTVRHRTLPRPLNVRNRPSEPDSR